MRRPSLHRRFIAGAATLAYLAAAIGFPVPERSPCPASEPFPCMGHGCGCRCAADCWDHCCCFSPDERLAWARARGVEPPAGAEQIAVAGWNTPRLRDREREGHSDCCCADAGGCLTTTGATAAARPSKARPSGTRWAAAWEAARCRGAATTWVAAGIATPPPPLAGWAAAPDLSDLLVDLAADIPSVPVSPPDPPPRSAAV